MLWHSLRPWWWLAAIPLFWIGFAFLRQTPTTKAWQTICDAHLLPHLIQVKRHAWRKSLPAMLILSGVSILVGLTGPTWSRLPVPTYHQILPRVVLLDMSDEMQKTDLSPNRLSRAKFKLHDLFHLSQLGQIGLIAYTAEPFVVAPLTEDGQTIDALLSALTPDIMPVGGNHLERALQQGAQSLNQAGYEQGQILVLTSTLPSPTAVAKARQLAQRGIQISILPITADPSAVASFAPLAHAGLGQVIPYSDSGTDLQQWLSQTRPQSFRINQHNNVPVWRDQGRWFIIPALVLLLPAFRRGWLMRVSM